MIDERIIKFIKSHHVLTVATDGTEGIYCAQAFYCYDAERNVFIFSSDDATRHARQMVEDARVAATVTLETRIVGRIRGLQICARAERGDERDKHLYMKRFPYTAAIDLTIWRLRPSFLKYTDNTLGFGKKLIWNEEKTQQS